MTPDEKSIIVANSLGDSLTFLDPRTAEVQRVVRGIARSVPAAVLARHEVVRHRGQPPEPCRRLPLGRQGPAAGQARVSTGKTPSHIWIDSRSTTAYVSMQDSDELVAIDLATQALKWRIKTGPMPADVYGTADDRTLLVGLTGSDGVEVFDVSGPAPKSVRRIKTGEGAHAFRAAGDRRHVFLSNRVANTISKHRPADAAGGRHLSGAGRPGLHRRARGRQAAAWSPRAGPASSP